MKTVWNAAGYFEQIDEEEFTYVKHDLTDYALPTTKKTQTIMKTKKRKHKRPIITSDMEKCPYCTSWVKKQRVEKHIRNVHPEKINENEVKTLVNKPVEKHENHIDRDTINQNNNIIPESKKLDEVNQTSKLVKKLQKYIDSFGGYSSTTKIITKDFTKKTNTKLPKRKPIKENENIAPYVGDLEGTYEEIAYGKSNSYMNKGDHVIRDNGLFGSTVLEDDIES